MIETNAVKVWRDFEKLETKEMKKALMAGLKGAANTLRKGVRNELKSSVKNANKKNQKFNDSLVQGVRVTKVKDGHGFFYVYTTIASSRKTGSGSYRLHFLENGTQDRWAYTRKGGHAKSFRGRITPLNFFKKAESSFKPNYDRILQAEIDKAVTKINNKNR